MRGGGAGITPSPPQKKIFSKIFFKNIQFGGGVNTPPKKNFLKNIYFGGGNYPPQNGLGGGKYPPQNRWGCLRHPQGRGNFFLGGVLFTKFWGCLRHPQNRLGVPNGPLPPPLDAYAHTKDKVTDNQPFVCKTFIWKS